MVTPAQAKDCWRDAFGRQVCSDQPASGFGYYYDRATQTFYPEDGGLDGTETVDGVRLELRYVVYCPGNTPDDPLGSGECTTAPCTLSDGRPGLNYIVYERTDPSVPWVMRPGAQCRGLGEPIPLADFEAEIMRIIEAHFKEVTEPAVTVAPAVNAVVNLPVLASTPDRGPLGFDIANPLPGTVEATPEYRWSWSNGISNRGPGVGYDGTSPSQNPGHYPVKSTYTNGGNGSVDLIVEWSITLTVDGIPPITDIEPLEYDATAGFVVRNARTVLVD